MQVQVDIRFDELLKIVKNLPGIQLSKLKSEIEKETKQDKKRDLEALLNGPAFSSDTIDKTQNEGMLMIKV
jgi:hypothetical protein